NNMLNLMDATATIVGLARIRAKRVRTGGKRCCRQEARQNYGKKFLGAVECACLEYFHMLISLNCKFTVGPRSVNYPGSREGCHYIRVGAWQPRGLPLHFDFI